MIIYTPFIYLHRFVYKGVNIFCKRAHIEFSSTTALREQNVDTVKKAAVREVRQGLNTQSVVSRRLIG